MKDEGFDRMGQGKEGKEGEEYGRREA